MKRNIFVLSAILACLAWGAPKAADFYPEPGDAALGVSYGFGYPDLGGAHHDVVGLNFEMWASEHRSFQAAMAQDRLTDLWSGYGLAAWHPATWGWGGVFVAGGLGIREGIGPEVPLGGGINLFAGSVSLQLRGEYLAALDRNEGENGTWHTGAALRWVW